jgi:hypothetical protein
MAEAHISASEDHLISGLNFAPGKSGSYVVESRAVRFNSEAGDRYTPGGARLVRIRLQTPNFLDPLSCKLVFDLKELGNAAGVTLLSPNAISIFQRARVICGSTVCDDCDQVGRLVTMLNLLKPPARVMNGMLRNGGAADDSTHTLASGTLDEIAAGDARTMCCSLDFLGLFSQPKWLPCGLMNSICLELELNPDAAYSTSGSVNWCLENVFLKANEKILDGALREKYAAHILQGKTLPIATTQMSTTLHVVTSENFTVALARGFSRLMELS